MNAYVPLSLLKYRIQYISYSAISPKDATSHPHGPHHLLILKSEKINTKQETRVLPFTFPLPFSLKKFPASFLRRVPFRTAIYFSRYSPLMNYLKPALF